MRFGLVLGGGGVVGITWEIGVLAGLGRSGVLDPAEAAVIVGTSAGSVVGTRLALGASLESLVEEQSRPVDDGPATGETAPRGDLSKVMEIFGELRKAPAVTPEVARIVGQKAMEAETPPEEQWVASFEATIGKGTPFPAGRDLRIAALDCNTGERRVWTAADEGTVDLARAVASSCAVPGMFPTVGIGGSRYTDGGVWSGTNADVLLEDRLDAVILVAPTAAAPAQPGRRPAIDVEVERLEAAGTPTVRIVPGERFAAEVGLLNLMNPAKRTVGLDVGLEDGAAAAVAVKQLLAGS
jgi:NTE family protein